MSSSIVSLPIGGARASQRPSCKHCGEPLKFRQRIWGIQFCCADHGEIYRQRRVAQIASLLEQASRPRNPLRMAGFLGVRPLNSDTATVASSCRETQLGWRRREPVLPAVSMDLRLMGPIGPERLMTAAQPKPGILGTAAWLPPKSAEGRLPEMSQRLLGLPSTQRTAARGRMAAMALQAY